MSSILVKDENNNLVSPLDIACKAPVLDDLEGKYNWERQERDYGTIGPFAYKMSTQTFDGSGNAKDSDKDYD